MRTIVLVLLLSWSGLASATETDSLRLEQRTQQLNSLADSGILTDRAQNEALQFSDESFDTLMEMGRQMKRTLNSMGYSNMSEVEDKSALEAIREAGRDVLDSVPDVSTSDAEERMDGLTSGDCLFPERLNRDNLHAPSV